MCVSVCMCMCVCEYVYVCTSVCACMFMCVYACHSMHVEVKGQYAGAGSLFLPYEFWGLSSGHQA